MKERAKSIGGRASFDVRKSRIRLLRRTTSFSRPGDVLDHVQIVPTAHADLASRSIQRQPTIIRQGDAAIAGAVTATSA